MKRDRFAGAKFVTKDKKPVKFGSMGNGNMAEDSMSAGKPFKPGRLSANATLKAKKPPYLRKSGETYRKEHGIAKPR